MSGRILAIAGEASGDLHGAGVVRALRLMAPGTEVFGIGGERMRQEGMEIIRHIDGMAFMGFVEVVKHLGTIRRVTREMTDLLDTRRPDAVLLIDYPGFNLRFARKAARRGIPVIYYISPQVWAWHRSRVKAMRSTVTQMKVVFPFEVEIYRQAGIDVEFVGHPIVERIGAAKDRAAFFRQHKLDPARKLLALLPGSRLQEITHMLPVMVEAARTLTSEGTVQAVLGIAPNLGPAPFLELLRRYPGVRAVENATYDLMAYADAAIVTSGTATLETGWFGTPMVIVYRTSPLTYFIGRMLVDVSHIGLVNIVAGKGVVPELIQDAMTPEAVVRLVKPMLHDPAVAGAMRSALGVIRERLGGPGASAKVATALLNKVEAA